MEGELRDGLYFKKGNSFYLICDNIMKLIDLNKNINEKSYKIDDVYIDNKLINFKKILKNDDIIINKDNNNTVMETIESELITDEVLNDKIKDNNDLLNNNKNSNILKEYDEFQSKYKINEKESSIRYESIIDCDEFF